MDGRRGSRRVYSRHRLPGVLAETEKSLVKGFFHLFLAMFIVGELLTYVWSREGMHDALWLAYIATFIKQWA